MKIIKVNSDGRYTHHGIAYTEHDGYQGTSDNRWSLKLAISHNLARYIKDGEEYQISVNGKNTQEVFKKEGEKI